MWRSDKMFICYSSFLAQALLTIQSITCLLLPGQQAAKATLEPRPSSQLLGRTNSFAHPWRINSSRIEIGLSRSCKSSVILDHSSRL